jgi:outer membrane phospholipase A
MIGDEDNTDECSKVFEYVGYTDVCIEYRYDGTIDGLTVGISDNLMDGSVVGKVLGDSE